VDGRVDHASVADARCRRIHRRAHTPARDGKVPDRLSHDGADDSADRGRARESALVGPHSNAGPRRPGDGARQAAHHCARGGGRRVGAAHLVPRGRRGGGPPGLVVAVPGGREAAADKLPRRRTSREGQLPGRRVGGATAFGVARVGRHHAPAGDSGARPRPWHWREHAVEAGEADCVVLSPSTSAAADRPPP
jgi:hypothetical protein